MRNRESGLGSSAFPASCSISGPPAGRSCSRYPFATHCCVDRVEIDVAARRRDGLSAGLRPTLRWWSRWQLGECPGDPLGGSRPEGFEDRHHIAAQPGPSPGEVVVGFVVTPAASGAAAEEFALDMPVAEKGTDQEYRRFAARLLRSPALLVSLLVSALV